MKNSSCQDEMLALIEHRPFDTKRANVLLQSIDDLEQVISDKNGYKTTLLAETVDSNNLDAVQLLLEHGADPNYVSPDYDCPFLDLQDSREDESEDRIRYAITKLFLAHGADPNLIVEGLSVYDYATIEVYDFFEETSWWPYILKIYKLLVLYGGGGHEYEKPVFSEPIDLRRADEYQIRFRQEEDGYHISGFLLNPDGKIIGQL